jgi:hypothetical protein
MGSDVNTGIAALRDAYRPKRVLTLFVGESSPAQGTHFYLANSNLYRAVQAAFATAFGGESAVGVGVSFLRAFKSRGCWMVDLADRPVNRLAGAERRAAVSAGIPGLAEIITATKPKAIVMIKSDIAQAVAEAIELATLKTQPTVLALRYPLRQYRLEFIAQLADFLRTS